MSVCYLRMDSDRLEDATRYTSLRDAKDAYRAVAMILLRYGQRIDASIHIAPSMDEVVEYPDFVLSVGPRGGLRCERT